MHGTINIKYIKIVGVASRCANITMLFIVRLTQQYDLFIVNNLTLHHIVV